MSTSSSGSCPAAYAAKITNLRFWLNLSTIPFAGGWYGLVFLALAPQCLVQVVHSCALYGGPPSVQISSGHPCVLMERLTHFFSSVSFSDFVTYTSG